MSNKWICQVSLYGTIHDAIDMLLELKEQYPGDKYRFTTDQDRDIWLIDTEIENAEEAARMADKLREQKKEDLKELKRLKKKYGEK